MMSPPRLPRSRCPRGVPAVLVALLLASLAPVLPAYAQEPPPEEQPPPEAGETVDQITPEEEALLANLQVATNRRTALESQLQQLEMQIADAEIRLAAAKDRLAQASYRRGRAQAVLAVAERELALAERRLAEQAVEAYISGGDDPMPAFAAFLSLDNPTDVASAFTLAGAVSENQGAVIHTAADLRALVDELRVGAVQEEEAATQERDEAQAAVDDLVDRRDRPGGLKAQVQSAVRAHEGIISGLDVKKAEFEERLRAILAAGSAIASDIAAAQRGEVFNQAWRGTLSWPVPGARIGSSFGPRVHPIFGAVRHHAGVDAAAPTGTPVYAAADGTVLHSGPRGGYGNAVVLLHGEALATVYAHLSSVSVHPGQRVLRGEQIGLVGSTGQSTGPHLHWEARILGEAVDPVPFIGSVTPLASGEATAGGATIEWTIDEANGNHRGIVKIGDGQDLSAVHILDAGNATQTIEALRVGDGLLDLVVSFVDKRTSSDDRSRLEIVSGAWTVGDQRDEIEPRTLGATQPGQ